MDDYLALPTEDEIEKRIDGLSASEFQILGEYFVEINFPKVFRYINPLGRNPKGDTISGWPDITSDLPDGTFFGAEVTKDKKWIRHLPQGDQSDRKNLPEGLVGLVFLSWVRYPQLGKVKKHKEYFVERGIQPDNVIFLFRDQILKELRNPKYARVWVDLLGLPASPLPFEPIEEVDGVFGDWEKINVYIPSKEEYEQGLVHRPAAADAVKQILDETKWAIVRGKGESGKTVLAIQIARSDKFSVVVRNPSDPEDGAKSRRMSLAYYLNLADIELTKDTFAQTNIANVIPLYGDDRILFIIDNIHLYEHGVKQIFNHWKRCSRGSSLLMLGRTLEGRSGTRGSRRPFDTDELKEGLVTLETNPKDLVGVYRRLAYRVTRDSGKIPEPPVAESAVWQETFRGSLFEFSAAVARKIPDLLEGKWPLIEDDAKEETRERHLKDISHEERLDLLRVAAMAKLELDTPREGLGQEYNPVGQAIRNGIVYQLEVGKTRTFIKYHMIYPGLAKLILAAAGFDSFKEMELLLDIVTKAPFTGLLLSSRLENAGETRKAEKVLREIANNKNSLTTSLLTPNLKFTAINILRFKRFGLISTEEVDGLFLANKSELLKAAVNSHLGQLARFVRFADKKKMKQTYSFIIRSFREENDEGELIYKNWFVEKALLTPLSDFEVFFNWAKIDLRNVFSSVVETLNNKNEEGELIYKDRFVEKVLGTPLYWMVVFLKYAKTDLYNIFTSITETLSRRTEKGELIYKDWFIEKALLAPLAELTAFLNCAKADLYYIFTSVTETLNEENEEGELKYKDWFVEKALRTPLNELTAFLNYAETGLYNVFRSVTEALNEENERSELIYKEDIIKKFFEASIEHLTLFLELANVHMTNVFDTLVESLISSEYRIMLVRNISKTRLDHLSGFFKYTEEEIGQVDLNPILAAIEIYEWEKAREFPIPDELDSIKTFAEIVARYGRPELAEAPARNIILKTRSREQHSYLLGLHHISYTLRYGRGVGTEEIVRFLDIIATHDWLDGQYKSPRTKPGSIAGFLSSVWAYNGDKILKRFLTDSLVSRVEYELEGIHDRRTVEILSWKTQLLGITGLFDLLETENIVKAPVQICIDEAVDYPTPLSELDYLGFIQVQFWLGLRELARLFPGGLSVPAEAGDKILELWRATQDDLNAEVEVDSRPEIRKFKALNADMTEWLERCEAEGWQLVTAPRIRIP